jgi:anti-sigma regulatory factor (Ser/Thr protein kinase)
MYRDPGEFLAGVGSFLVAGLDAGAPAMAAVPAPRLELLRECFGDTVRFVDMTELGRNPSRIIPAVRDWVETLDGRAARFVGEPIWPGRRASEAAEGLRHEALLNLAFAHDAVTILCPYDVSALDPGVVADAQLTHPLLVCHGHTEASPRYTDPEVVYAAADRALPLPSGPVSRMDVSHDLVAMRRFVAGQVAIAELDEARRFDLLVAANEAVVNALVHGGGQGVVSVWTDGASVVCEITGGGHITDPLIGRRRPQPETPHGRGLWIMNQLCDLVELRPGAGATTLRLHMSLT